MRKPAPALTTRTEESDRGELPLTAPSAPPRSHLHPPNRAAERIREALLRWLDEEL